jgi:hypothetical protein
MPVDESIGQSEQADVLSENGVDEARGNGEQVFYC